MHTSHEPILSEAEGGAEAALPGSGRDAPSLEVLAAGDLPLLRISDVTCDGVGKSTLWKRMGVSAANHWLADVLSPNEEEMRYGRSTAAPNATQGVLHYLQGCYVVVASRGS